MDLKMPRASWCSGATGVVVWNACCMRCWPHGLPARGARGKGWCHAPRGRQGLPEPCARWVDAVLNPGGRSIRPVATMPSQYQERLAVLVLARDAARNKGEFLMKRFLTARVASDQYVDSAGPEYLTSPVTKELLELDRYYFQAGVALSSTSTAHKGHGPPSQRAGATKTHPARRHQEGPLPG